MDKKFLNKHLGIIYDLFDSAGLHAYLNGLRQIKNWAHQQSWRYDAFIYDNEPLIKAVDKMEALLVAVFSIGGHILTQFGHKLPVQSNECPHCEREWQDMPASFIKDHLETIYDFLEFTDYESYCKHLWEITHWGLFTNEKDPPRENEDALMVYEHLSALIRSIFSIGAVILQKFDHKIPKIELGAPLCQASLQTDTESNVINPHIAFLHLLGHELNTQLSGIFQTIGVLEKYRDKESGVFSADTGYYFTTIQGVVGETINVLSNMLATPHMDANGHLVKGGISKESFDIKKFIRGFKRPFSLYQLHNKGLNIKVHSLPEGGLIDTDKAKLAMIINNLLHNAFKYSHEETKVVLECYCINGDQVTIKVSSMGYPISDDKIDHLFEPYWQIESGKGWGLGLFICKMYAELLGGNISVDSNESGLTTFTVNIPV